MATTFIFISLNQLIVSPRRYSHKALINYSNLRRSDLAVKSLVWHENYAILCTKKNSL